MTDLIKYLAPFGLIVCGLIAGRFGVDKDVILIVIGTASGVINPSFMQSLTKKPADPPPPPQS
jgi:hypothetical protein